MEIKKPMDVPEQFPVRKSKKQKQAFRASVQAYLESLGYAVSFEKGSFGARNIIAGDPKTAKFLVTAHYDTCARMYAPNLITPCNLLLYLLYQFAIVVPIFLIGGICGGVAEYLADSEDVGLMVRNLSLLGILALLIAGPANPTNANDNTSGVVTVLEIARSLPENLRGQVCFVLFDLEEAGLIGSASYRSKHKKESKNQIVLNLDCVGEGDEIYFFPTSKLKKDREKLACLESICARVGKKNIVLRKKGFSIYPSDQANFPYGVGICALKRGKLGLYMSRIHTPRDTILDETNVNILRAALITMIGGKA